MKEFTDSETKEMYEWINRNWSAYSLAMSIITALGGLIIYAFTISRLATILVSVSLGMFMGLVVGIAWCNSGKP